MNNEKRNDDGMLQSLDQSKDAVENAHEFKVFDTLKLAIEVVSKRNSFVINSTEFAQYLMEELKLASDKKMKIVDANGELLSPERLKQLLSSEEQK